MSSGECQLIFEGLENPGDEALKRFKTACIVDLELSVEDTMAVLNGERSVLCSGKEEDLKAFAKILKKNGVKVSLSGETGEISLEPHAASPDETDGNEGSDETVVFEFGDIELSQSKHEPKPKEYVLHIDEEPEGAQKSQLENMLTFDDKDENEEDLNAFVSKIEQVEKSKVEKKPIPTSTLELTLGPEPEEIKAPEPIVETHHDDFTISKPSLSDPESDVGKMDLSFSIEPEEEPVKASVPHAAPPQPPAPPKIETTMTMEVEEPAVKEVIAKPPAPAPQVVSPKVEATSPPKTVTPITPTVEEIVEEKHPAKVATKSADFAFSQKQVLVLFFIGLVFLAGANFLFQSAGSFNEPTLPIPDIQADALKDEKPQPTQPSGPKIPQWSGTFKNEMMTVFASLTEGNKGTSLLRISATTPEPPPPTAEEIVKKKRPTPWLTRIDGEPVVITPQSPGKFSGSGTLFAFVEDGQIRRRIPITALVQLDMNADQSIAATQIIISYTPNDETELPAKNKVIEATKKDSYRIALEAKLELTKK